MKTFTITNKTAERDHNGRPAVTSLEILDRAIASLRQTIKRQALSPIQTPNGARLHADNMASLARAIAQRALITN